MKTKKRISILLMCVAAVICLVFAFTFAACKKSNDDEQGSKTDSGNVSVVDPKTEVEVDIDDIDDVDKLVFSRDASGGGVLYNGYDEQRV